MPSLNSISRLIAKCRIRHENEFARKEELR